MKKLFMILAIMTGMVLFTSCYSNTKKVTSDEIADSTLVAVDTTLCDSTITVVDSIK